MQEVKVIKHLKHSEIDKEKWDKCINESDNGLIYAYSWYLDIVSPNWEALVQDNYESIMPLTWRKKWGVKYICQPYFAQQLGVFARKELIDVDVFISAIPKKFKFLEFNLNEKNDYAEYILKHNSNYKLDISKPYTEIVKGYNRNCKRNLKKAIQANFQISMSIRAKEFVNFVVENLEEQIDGVGRSVFELLERLVIKCIEKDTADLVGLYDSNNQLHAAGFFLKNKERLIFSVCASTEFGKQNQAMYQLVNSQIDRYASVYKWYDFSGSNIKGIAYFNSTFGAVPTSYKTLSIKRLPKLINLLRR